jgi:hypothetical protein
MRADPPFEVAICTRDRAPFLDACLDAPIATLPDGKTRIRPPHRRWGTADAGAAR